MERPTSSASSTDSGSCTRTATLCSGRPLAFDQGQVQGSAGLVAEGVRGELAEGGVQAAGTDFLHQAFVAAAVFDQVGNGADLQAVFGREQLQVRQAGHGAVVFHDLADHRRRAAAGHGGEVAAGFGVTRAHEHAAFDRLQREDVAGLHQVVRACVGGHRGLHGAARGRRRKCRWSHLPRLRSTP